jgi:broad specificity phosphatase PhoE
MFLNSRPDLYAPVRPAVATRLLLARHGETDWNRQHRFQGQTDIALNSNGRSQAMALNASLKSEPLAAVYSSALRRAVETAQIIAAQHRLNVSRDERLNEIRMGDWEGMVYKDWANKYPSLKQALENDRRSVTAPNGESIDQLERRVLSMMKEIALAYPGETVCVIGHGMVNAVIRSHYLNIAFNDALRSMPAQGVWEDLDLPYPYM